MKLLRSYFNQKKRNKIKKHTKTKSIILFTKKGNNKALLLTIKKRLNDYFKISSLKEHRNKRIYKLFLNKKNINKKFRLLSIKKIKYDTSLQKYIDNSEKPLNETKESIEKFEEDKGDKSILSFKKKRLNNKSRSARR